MKRIFLLLFLVAQAGVGWFCSHDVNAPAASSTPGEIVLNEILYDPVGLNAGNQLVELKNLGAEPVELSGWWLCARQDYAQIPKTSVPAAGFLVIHIGAQGANTSSDVFLPFMLPLQSVSDLALYRDANFSNPASMIHFVQWGGVPPTNRESEAVTKGLWTKGDFVPSVQEGHSIEYDGEGNTSGDWIEQTNPTIGF
ncbi:lamin tail domain-containing protein [Candidatus Parcubacteria bacterium]|nr:MAG: lamin tail domain-containing protein [Candidatus Parcubacteria bacterium]